MNTPSETHGQRSAIPRWRAAGRPLASGCDLLGALLLTVFFLPAPLRADGLSLTDPSDKPDPTPPVTKSLWERDNLLPDPGGQRARLADRGVALGVFYTAEVFGNPLGGRTQGVAPDGLLTTALDVDFEKLAGWKNLKFHALAYYPHGPSGTDKFVGDQGRFSNIDFYDSVRLFELWLDQSFFNGRLSVRLGQLATDTEFANAEPSALYVNSDFGALPTLSFNAPVPIYAIATPGVRVRWAPVERFYFQAAVYDGNPDPDTLGDPSPGFRPGTHPNRHGVRFNLNSKEGAFSIYEAGWLPNREKNATGLPGAYRLGFFLHTDTFSDLRSDRLGRSLADPRSDGVPRAREGNYGVYLAAAQTVWRGAGADNAGDVALNASAPTQSAAGSPLSEAIASPPSGPAISVFLRLGLAPPDRSPAPFHLDTGVNWRAPLPGRARDVLGLAFSHTVQSGRLRQLGRDVNRFTGTRDALPDHESVLELTYQVNLTPWVQVQPDLQYVIHPGGSPALGDALVLGLRTVITF